MEDYMKEIWKIIKDYENYEVSNYGRVRSLIFKNNNTCKKRKKPLIMKFSKRSGYYVINLRNENGRKSFQVHRLVAKAFLKEDTKRKFVNHKDENRLNNKVDNLEYCTQKENANWSKHKLQHCKKFKSKLNEQYIRMKYNKYELTLKKKYIGLYDTLEEAIIVRNRLIKGDAYYK